MKEKTYFLDMFSDYEPPESLKNAISQAAIVAADLNPAERRIRMEIRCEEYIPCKVLDAVAADICDLYGLRDLQLYATYPATQLQQISEEDLLELFVAENSMTRGSLAGAKWQWEETTLTVSLLANGKKELEKCIPAVQAELSRQFGVSVKILIEAGKALEGKELFDAMEKMRASMIAEIPKSAPEQKKDSAPVQSDALYGKPIRGVNTPMRDLNLDMGTVIVEGKVFAVEHKELKKRNAWVINFDMTDHTGSVRINRFMEASEAKPFLEHVKVGAVLRIQGRLMINQFDNEMVLRPNSMMPGSMPKRKDTAEGMKRVELHLHTSMSNMDALTGTGDAVKTAAGWGHRAIGITDHGVVQSFPDAMKASGKAKVAGFEMTPDMMTMMNGFTVLRLLTMAGGMMDAKFTKEDLLKLNSKLNKIRKR